MNKPVDEERVAAVGRYEAVKNSVGARGEYLEEIDRFDWTFLVRIASIFVSARDYPTAVESHSPIFGSFVCFSNPAKMIKERIRKNKNQ